MTKVRILNPSIDDYNNTVVIRGVVDNDSLPDLNIDFYQRELLPSKSRREIRNALLQGDRLPDIVLGMRGDSFEMDDKDVLLTDRVFIIDGRQRRDTILECCQEALPQVPRLGAVVHLNTNPDWERQLFHKLNLFQSKVSPNILLRNNKEDHMGLATLYGLTKNDKHFVMYDKVCWQQTMARGELITANMVLFTVLQLHSHLSGSPARSIREMVPTVDKLVAKIGVPIFRSNVKAFFDLIDECWGIRRISIKGGAPYLKATFMGVLARVLSDHPDFWKQPDDRRLMVGYELKRKLAKFNINDPEIYRLASTSGAARLTLYLHMINWLNSGKRTKKLVSRNASIAFEAESEEEVGSDSEVA